MIGDIGYIIIELIIVNVKNLKLAQLAAYNNRPIYRLTTNSLYFLF